MTTRRRTLAVALGLAAPLLFASAPALGAKEDPCLKHRADLEKLQGCYNARITRDGTDFDARVAMGALLMQQGKNAEALKQFEAVLAISSGHIAAMNGKASVLLVTGKEREGLKLLEDALSLDPNNLQTVTNYARVALTAGEVQIASDMYNLAMAMNPNDTEANLGIAELHLTKGNRKDALIHLAKAVELDDTNIRANYLLGLELLDEKPEQAILFLDRAAFLAPGDPKAWVALGRARFRLGLFRQAGQAFVEAGKILPEDAVIHLEIGKVYYELHDYKEAADTYNEGLALAKKQGAPAGIRAELHFHLGVVYMAEQKYPAARAQYQNVLALDAAHPLAKLNLGIIEHLQGNLEEAVNTFRSLLVDHPELHDARYNLIATLLAQGEVGMARMELADLPEGPLKQDAERRIRETKGAGVVTTPPGAATPAPKKTPAPRPK